MIPIHNGFKDKLLYRLKDNIDVITFDCMTTYYRENYSNNISQHSSRCMQAMFIRNYFQASLLSFKIYKRFPVWIAHLCNWTHRLFTAFQPEWYIWVIEMKDSFELLDTSNLQQSLSSKVIPSWRNIEEIIHSTSFSVWSFHSFRQFMNAYPLT